MGLNARKPNKQLYAATNASHSCRTKVGLSDNHHPENDVVLDLESFVLLYQSVLGSLAEYSFPELYDEEFRLKVTD